MTPTPAVSAVVRAVQNRRVASWIFRHYLAIAPPSFVGGGPPRRGGSLALAGA